jgi:DNA-directed RNA polymerases I, II, and III subunit RPABC5
MEYPIRCFSCNKILGNKYEKYNELIESGKTVKEALDTLAIIRPCCRKIVMCSVNLSEKIDKYRNCKIGLREEEKVEEKAIE